MRFGYVVITHDKFTERLVLWTCPDVCDTSQARNAASTHQAFLSRQLAESREREFAASLEGHASRADVEELQRTVLSLRVGPPEEEKESGGVSLRVGPHERRGKGVGTGNRAHIVQSALCVILTPLSLF